MRLNNERAVSDVVGYLILFGIVIVAISATVAVGVTVNSDIQESIAASNSEDAMGLVNSQIEDIHQRNADSRETEIRLNNQQLTSENHATIRIDIDGGDTDSVEYTSQRIEYVSGDVTTSIELGSVITKQSDNAIMRESPPFEYNEELTLINVIEIRENDSVSGSGFATIAKEFDDDVSESIQEEDITLTKTIETTPSHAQTWENYFNNQDDVTITSTSEDIEDGIVEMEMETDELLLQRSVIPISIST